MYNFLIPSPLINDPVNESFVIKYRRISGVPETAFTTQTVTTNSVQLDLIKNVNYEIRVSHSCAAGSFSNEITTNFIAKNTPSLAFIQFNLIPNTIFAQIKMKIGSDVGNGNTYNLYFQKSATISVKLPDSNLNPTVQDVYNALLAIAPAGVISGFNSSDNTFLIKVALWDGLLNCTAIA